MYMYMSVLLAGAYRGQKWVSDLWSWSYKWLWAAVLVLGVELSAPTSERLSSITGIVRNTWNREWGTMWSSWIFSLHVLNIVVWTFIMFTGNMQWGLWVSPWSSPISVLILKCLSRFYCFFLALPTELFQVYTLHSTYLLLLATPV